MEHFDWVMGFFIPYTNFFIFAALLFAFAKKPARQFALTAFENFTQAKESSASQLAKAQKQATALQDEWNTLEQQLFEQQRLSLQATEQHVAELESDAQRRLAAISAETTRTKETMFLQMQARLGEQILDQMDASVKGRFDQDGSGELAKSFADSQLANLSIGAK